MRRILAIGECMVELAPRGDGAFAIGFAGDTFNTAWYLRKSLPNSFEVGYLSAVGTDAVSQQMLGFMQAEGLATTNLRQIPGKGAGLYMIQLSQGERSFTYWRETSAARGLADDPAHLAATLRGVELAYLSGITLAILSEAARDTLSAALAQARASGTTLVFDPNIRPALWPDPAQMRAAITSMAGAADIVLPSFDDEARHFGDATPEATARRYREAGAGLVVVKNGPEPMVTLDTGQTDPTLHPVTAAEVVDSTAAGDSFNAGFLARRLQGAPLADCVQSGAALAARVIGGPGALVRAALD